MAEIKKIKVNGTTYDLRDADAVKKTGDSMSGSLILRGNHASDYGPTDKNRLSVYDTNDEMLRTDIFSGVITHANGRGGDLSLKFASSDGSDFTDNELILPKKSGTVAIAEDIEKQLTLSHTHITFYESAEDMFFEVDIPANITSYEGLCS